MKRRDVVGFPCPHCSAEVEVTVEAGQVVVTCPMCSRQVDLAAAEAAEEPQDPWGVEDLNEGEAVEMSGPAEIESETGNEFAESTEPGVEMPGPEELEAPRRVETVGGFGEMAMSTSGTEEELACMAVKSGVIEALEAKVTLLDAQKKEVEDERDSLLRQLTEKEDMARREHRAEEDEIQRLNDLLGETQKAKERAEDAANGLRTEVDTLRKEIDRLEKQVEGLHKTLHRVREDSDEQANRLQKQWTNLLEQKALVEEELARAKATIFDLEVKVTALQTEASRARTETPGAGPQKPKSSGWMGGGVVALIIVALIIVALGVWGIGEKCGIPAFLMGGETPQPPAEDNDAEDRIRQRVRLSQEPAPPPPEKPAIYGGTCHLSPNMVRVETCEPAPAEGRIYFRRTVDVNQAGPVYWAGYLVLKKGRETLGHSLVECTNSEPNTCTAGVRLNVGYLTLTPGPPPD